MAFAILSSACSTTVAVDRRRPTAAAFPL